MEGLKPKLSEMGHDLRDPRCKVRQSLPEDRLPPQAIDTVAHCGACLLTSAEARYVSTGKAEEVEMVDHPKHYGGDGPYEVFKVVEAWGLDSDAYLFTAVKYLARAGKKDPTKTLEDLRKARVYLDRKITNLKREATGG